MLEFVILLLELLLLFVLLSYYLSIDEHCAVEGWLLLRIRRGYYFLYWLSNINEDDTGDWNEEEEDEEEDCVSGDLEDIESFEDIY